MRVLLLILLALLPATAGAAEPRLITSLSQSRIDISYRFAGGELLIFGAIQYPRGRIPAAPPGIAVVLRGPTEALVVHRKERVAGIWVNRNPLRFESVPSFYAVSTTEPISDLLDERNAAIYEIGLDFLQLSPATAADPVTTRDFQQGLSRQRGAAGLFIEQPYGVTVTENILYRTRIPIPSSVPVGNYQAEIYLIADSKVVARSTAPVIIDKSGFERDIYVFAMDSSFLYGLTAIAIALGLGFLAAVVSRRPA